MSRSFAQNLSFETNLSSTSTANGAYCLATSGDKLVDLFASIGALRYSDDSRNIELFENALAEDKLLATKILFYARDIREGLGERKTFRTLLAYSADKHPEIVMPNINLIGFYGRYDDLYALVGTKCEDAMWSYMKEQFMMDLANAKLSKPCSLLAKWIKTPNASSATTKKLGILTSQKLGYKDVGYFKKDLKRLRKYLDIVEIKITSSNFSEIIYDQVPAKAQRKYGKLFSKKDGDRYSKYLESIEKGEAKINTSTLYPYDITHKYINSMTYSYSNDCYKITREIPEEATLEVLWKNLPNYIEDGENVLIMADTSGSMVDNVEGLPMAAALGLAMYFAERVSGDFHNKFMTFSERPVLQTIVGSTLKEKINNMATAKWNSNTNLDSAMETLYNTAIKYETKPEDMPKAIVIISDMQIDSYGGVVRMNETFYEKWSRLFNEAGYKMPNIIFWNVNSTKNTFHIDAHRKGVQLLSGYSTSTFKTLLKSLDKTPVETMLGVTLSERYAPITIG